MIDSHNVLHTGRMEPTGGIQTQPFVNITRTQNDSFLWREDGGLQKHDIIVDMKLMFNGNIFF